MNIQIISLLALVLSLSMLLLVPSEAHCDTLDGPVVTAAQKALDTDDVNLVLYLDSRGG